MTRARRKRKPRIVARTRRRLLLIVAAVFFGVGFSLGLLTGAPGSPTVAPAISEGGREASPAATSVPASSLPGASAEKPGETLRTTQNPAPAPPAEGPGERTPAPAQNSMPAPPSHTVTPSRHRLRGVYVVRHALRNRETIDAAVEGAAAAGANALFVQVNGRAEAYYPSAILPLAQDVAPDFDPLQYVLEQAGARGMEVHAWINAYTAGMLIDLPEHPDHVLRRHPEWVTYDRSGRSLWDYDWSEAQDHVPARMLDPGLPEVADFVVDAVMEVARGYPVDGIHLDYIRYPSTRFGFHPDSVARFSEVYGFDPLALIQDAPDFVARHGRAEFDRRTGLWDDWRREQVTGLVARLSSALDGIGRDVVFSVAVEPDATTAAAERLQDWPRWIANDYVDSIVPMAYSPDGSVVRTRVEQTVQRAGDRVFVYAALGAYMVTDAPDGLTAQIVDAAAAGAAGTIMFSSDTLVEHPAVLEAAAKGWQNISD